MWFLCLVVFIIGAKGSEVTITTGLTTTAGTERHKDVIGPVEVTDTEDSRRRVATFAKENGVGLEVNEDAVTDESNFVRPCGFQFNNMECIRKFLKDNSKCKPSYGHIGEFHLAQNTELFPLLNLTITDSHLITTGLDNYKIIEFYYNKVTCKLVIAFEIYNLNETTELIYFSFQRTAKESVVLADYANVFTKRLIITVIIPDVPHLKLELAQAHTYLPEANPLFEVGPKAYTSDDPDVKEVYANLLTSLPIVLRERALFKTALFAGLIIQETICDFGVKLYRV